MSNYDPLDRVGQITDSVLGNTNTFTYDSLDSILNATDNYSSPRAHVSYAYDLEWPSHQHDAVLGGCL